MKKNSWFLFGIEIGGTSENINLYDDIDDKPISRVISRPFITTSWQMTTIIKMMTMMLMLMMCLSLVCITIHHDIMTTIKMITMLMMMTMCLSLVCHLILEAIDYYYYSLVCHQVSGDVVQLPLHALQSKRLMIFQNVIQNLWHNQDVGVPVRVISIVAVSYVSQVSCFQLHRYSVTNLKDFKD